MITFDKEKFLRFYAPEIYKGGFFLRHDYGTPGEKISLDEFIKEFHDDNVIISFLNDIELQQMTIVSSNIGFGLTFTKVYKKKETKNMTPNKKENERRKTKND